MDSGQTLTPYCVALVYIWQVLGFYATIFLAGLKTISPDIYEASQIDGANRRQQVLFYFTAHVKRNHNNYLRASDNRRI